MRQKQQQAEQERLEALQKEQQARTEMRRSQRRTVIFAFLTVLCVGAVYFSYQSERAARLATQQAQHALAIADFREALRFIENKDHTRALAHLAQSVRSDPAWSSSRTLLVNLLQQKSWGLPWWAKLKHKDSINSVAFSADGSRVVTASQDNTARLWDVSPVLSDEQGLLPELAEAVAGLKLADYGAIEVLEDQSKRLQQLRERTQNAPFGKLTAESFTRWFLSDAWTRTISPLSKTTVPEYIERQLAAGRREQVMQEFPGHPLLKPQASENR